MFGRKAKNGWDRMAALGDFTMHLMEKTWMTPELMWGFLKIIQNLSRERKVNLYGDT
jgi:hypothetical protein